MQVVQLKTSLAGRRFSHGVGSLVAMPDEMAERFIVQGLGEASDADPEGDDVAAYGEGSDVLEVTRAAGLDAGVVGAPPKTGMVSVVEPQPPAGTVGGIGSGIPGATVTGLGPEHAQRVGPEPVGAATATATATDVAGNEPPSDRIADVRACVGRSAERARSALEREEAKAEEDQRPTLVTHLRSVADAPAGG